MNLNSKYSIIVSERVAQMLVSHVAFLAQVDKNAEENLTIEFEKAAKSLEFMPHRGSWLIGEYIPKNTYRFLVFQNRYMLIYQIIDYNVYIDYVLDCRQDYSWMIR